MFEVIANPDSPITLSNTGTVQTVAPADTYCLFKRQKKEKR